MGYPIIGLTGLPCSGKSHVGGIFEKWGCDFLQADRLAHEALDEIAAREAVIAHFGTDVLGADGRVDRTRLSRRVFSARSSDPEAAEAAANLLRLESIVHPVVLARIRDWMADCRWRTPAVLEAALLVASGLAAACDAVAVVTADDAVRLARARARGWTAGDLAARDARQRPALDALASGNAHGSPDLPKRVVWLANNGETHAPSAANDDLHRQLKAILES